MKTVLKVTVGVALLAALITSLFGRGGIPPYAVLKDATTPSAVWSVQVLKYESGDAKKIWDDLGKKGGHGVMVLCKNGTSVALAGDNGESDWGRC